MPQEDVIDVVRRTNRVAVQSMETLVEGAYLAQRQSTALGQAMLNAMDAQQQASQDLSRKLVGQMVEAQNLWWRLLQSSVTATVEAMMPGVSHNVAQADGVRTTVQERERHIYTPDETTVKETISTRQ